MPTPTTHPTQRRLDIEDDNQRQLRLGQLLQRINDSSSTSNTHADNNSRNAASSNITPFVRPGLSSFDFGVRETHAVEPPSELLSRVESFLPQMEAANAELARRTQSSPESVDIENLGNREREDDEDEDGDEDDEDGRQGQYIEMNLGLGVFDIRRRPLSDTTSTSSSSSASSNFDDDDSHSSTSNSTRSDEADSDSHSDSDASTSGHPGSLLNRPIRPLPKRARPNIVVLNESTTDNTQQ
ncbi:hypothetical protein ACEPAH_845 [Sanghuangporus vaninii]